jgi:hypothetical protein
LHAITPKVIYTFCMPCKSSIHDHVHL